MDKYWGSHSDTTGIRKGWQSRDRLLLSQTLLFGFCVFTGCAWGHPEENEEAVATHGKVWRKGCNLIFCKKISLVTLVLFPPSKDPLKLRRASSLTGQRGKQGKTENPLCTVGISFLGLESGCVFLSWNLLKRRCFSPRMSFKEF